MTSRGECRWDDERYARVLVIEPHPDDGALSMGGILASLVSRGVDIESLCVFSDHGEQTALRLHEQRRAWSDTLGSPWSGLGFPDAPVRFPAAASPPSHLGANLRTFIAVRKAMIDKVDTLKPDAIVGPLAVGDHVDHRLTHQVMLDPRIAATGAHIWMYEDYPYCDENPQHLPAALERVMAVTALSPDYFDLSAWIEAKVEVAMCYASQVACTRAELKERFVRIGTARALERSEVDAGSGNAMYERLWRVGTEVNAAAHRADLVDGSQE